MEYSLFISWPLKLKQGLAVVLCALALQPRSKDGCVWSYRCARLKCKTKHELNIIWHPLKATRGGFSTFKISPVKMVGGVISERVGKERVKKKKKGKETCFLKICDWKFQSIAPSLCPITIPYWKSTEAMKKEHFSSAIEMGLPLALLNFRLCLRGVGELLWVCGRPAGLLSHQ